MKMSNFFSINIIRQSEYESEESEEDLIFKELKPTSQSKLKI